MTTEILRIYRRPCQGRGCGRRRMAGSRRPRRQGPGDQRGLPEDHQHRTEHRRCGPARHLGHRQRLHPILKRESHFQEAEGSCCRAMGDENAFQAVYVPGCLPSAGKILSHHLRARKWDGGVTHESPSVGGPMGFPMRHYPEPFRTSSGGSPTALPETPAGHLLILAADG